MRIGFVGLGVMGEAMAGHLARAGHTVTGYDRRPETGADLVRAETAAGAAKNADVVITMLPNGAVVAEAVTEMLPALSPGSLLLDTSSAEPWITRATAARLAEAGVAMVDAPVSGASWGAQTANLVFMVGGADPDVARVRPLLDVMGKAVHHVGSLSAGHTMKAINNVVSALAINATVEALLVGRAHGLDPEVMADVLNEATGQSFWTSERLKQDVLSGIFQDAFKLELMRKDVGIATRLGREKGLDLPMLQLGEALYAAADRDIGPGRSLSEMVHWIEARTGVSLTD
jgi:3-hydroxyisobutyrate dehydrogenase